jgi:hypothetical protein
MTDALKHTKSHPHKYIGPVTYVYQGDDAPLAFDIDEEKGASLAEGLLSPTLVILHSTSMPIERLKVSNHNIYSEILETVRKLDHAIFAIFPLIYEYVRDLLPNEFGIEISPPPPLPGKRWAVRVTAWRDDESERVIVRCREAFLAPIGITSMRGVSRASARASSISPRRLTEVDIDDPVAAVLVGRFTPADATLGYDATASKYSMAHTDSDALETIKRLDHAWFAANPRATEYVRELLPDEFGGKLEPPPLGERWAVRVTAFRDLSTGQVMLRIRAGVLVPLDDAPTGGAK